MISLTSFSQYEIAALATVASTLLISSYILFKATSKVTLLFGLYTLSISAWSLCFFFMISTRSESLSLFWARILHIPGALIPPIFLHFTQCFLNIERKNFQKVLRWITYGSGAIFIPLIFLESFVKGSIHELGFPNYYMETGDSYRYYIIYFVSIISICHALMINAYRKETSFKRIQIISVVGSYAIGYAGGLAVFLPAYGISLPAYALYSIPIAISGIAYSILRYKFMEINLIFRISLAYGISLSLATIVFLLSVYIVESLFNKYLMKGVPTTLGICVVVFLFDPIKKRIIKFVDVFIFKSPDYQILLNGIEYDLRKSKTLISITENLAHQFKKIWKVDHAGFAIWDSNIGFFHLYPEVEFENQLITRIHENIDRTNFLVRTLETERRLFPFGIVVDEEVVQIMTHSMPGEKITFSKIRRSLRWLGASACIPITSNEEFLGFIVLGPKMNKTAYNEEDKKFLSHVADLLSQRVSDLLVST